MRVLLANLKHFYQRRGLWIAYVGLTIVAWFMVQWVLPTPGKEGGVFGGFLVCSFLWGLLMATTQMETASKPFSFCLPGHRDAVRRLVFLAGFIVSLAFLLIFAALLASPSFAGPLEFYVGSPGLLILLSISYFCASMTAYLLGAGVAFSLIRGGGSTLGLLTLVVALCAMFDVFTPIQYPLLHWPVAVIALALAVGLASWWWLGRRAWFRRSCARPWMGFFDPWDRRHAQRFRELYATRFIKNIPPAWDRFFQRVIGSRPPSAPGKYAWGALYTTCVLVAPQWKGILTLALAWTVFAGYFPAVAPMVMGLLPLMTVGFLQSPLGMALLVAGGRKERFFATAALILGFSVLWVLLFGALVGLTQLLAPIVPAVTVRGATLALHALGFEMLAIPLVVVPVVGLVQTVFYRKPMGLALSIILVATFMMISSTPLGLYRAVTPALAVGGTLLSWGICLSLLYRIAMHRDLVRQ
jgi:hypothetical protein